MGSIRKIITAIALCASVSRRNHFSSALSTTGRANNAIRTPPSPTSRRDALAALGWNIAAVTAGTAFLPSACIAAEDNQVLTEEEMAAKVAKKMALLKKKNTPASSRPTDGEPSPFPSDIRSDVNPDAATNLRSRSVAENAKIAMEKQKELNNRDQKQKREDMCEMLGRGC